jgi:SAM-dependent methyltransferase
MQTPSTLDQELRKGRERLFPPLTDPNWLILSARRRIFEIWLSQIPFTEMQVLDIGGRIQPYRPLISDRTCRYVALDLRSAPLVDLIAHGEQLPFADAGFDLVICTQVLEYVAQPARLVDEIHRVLKPAGVLLLSAPSACLQDGGEECWRFLPAGLRRLFGKFARVQIAAEGSSVAGFFRTMNACLEVFARYPLMRAWYRHTLCPVMNLAGAFFEKISGQRNQQFTANYSVLAEK